LWWVWGVWGVAIGYLKRLTIGVRNVVCIDRIKTVHGLWTHVSYVKGFIRHNIAVIKLNFVTIYRIIHCVFYLGQIYKPLVEVIHVQDKEKLLNKNKPEDDDVTWFCRRVKIIRDISCLYVCLQDYKCISTFVLYREKQQWFQFMTGTNIMN